MIRPSILMGMVLALCVTAFAQQKVNKKEAAEALKIAAPDLMNELFANDKAEKKYKGKLLQIEGTVLEVDRPAQVVILKGGQRTNVACEFPSSRKAQLAKCKVGEKVTIRGTFTGTVATGHAAIDKCEVVK